MKNVKVRSVMAVSLEQIKGLRKSFSITFEDNVTIRNCYYKDIILFRFIMDLANTYDVDIVSDLWVSNFYSDGYPLASIYTDMFSILFRQIVKPYIKEHGNNSICDQLFRDMYMTIHRLNSIFINDILRYSVGLDIMDLLEIQFDKELVASLVKANEQATPAAIANTYKVLGDVMGKPKYDGNLIKLLYKSGIGSIGQINQMLASRGFVTELDNKIFKRPMTNSFTLGCKNQYDVMIESRSGAKALNLAGSAIQRSEYLNRTFNLVAAVLKSVHHGDCGRAKYTDFYIRPDEFDSAGVKTYSHKLKELVGKNYICPVDKVEKTLMGDEEHLVGLTIKLRQAIYCGLSDKQSICSACIGELADGILEHQNLGHIVSVILMVLMSQGLLSAKHLLKTATSVMLHLSKEAQKYFMLKKNEEMYFKANVLGKKTKTVYLKINQKEAWGLSNIMNVSDIFSVNPSKVSKLTVITLIFRGKGGEETETVVPVQASKVKASLTQEMLSHIIKTGYEPYDEDTYLINMTDYLNHEPILKYDKVEYSLANLTDEFKSMIGTHKFFKVGDRYRSERTPDVLVQEIFDLLNSKLSVNIAMIEVLVYAFTVKDITNGNYDLGRGSKERNVGSLHQVLYQRSIGGWVSWDDLHNKVFDPVMYLDKNKPDNPMDVFLTPADVIKSHKEFHNMKSRKG